MYCHFSNATCAVFNESTQSDEQELKIFIEIQGGTNKGWFLILSVTNNSINKIF